MTRSKPAPARSSRNEVFEALAHEHRRSVLRILRERGRASLDELARELTTESRAGTLSPVDGTSVATVRAQLDQTHVPKLVTAELVRRTDGGVALTDNPVLEEPKFEDIVTVETPDWDDVLDAVACERRRVVLSTLQREEEQMTCTDLARSVRRIECDSGSDDSLESVRLDLYHVQLPVLERAGLVAFDAEERLATYQGHPEFDDDWLFSGPEDTPRSILTVAHHSQDVWTIEGRDNVSERGRALCEGAEDELFMMFTDERLVERACLRTLQGAVERDVDCYLGTQNADLRDLVRERASEVTIWEPQLDWLNLRPHRECIGRLMFADREAIMIGTLGEEGPDGRPQETAITGSGENNPLVVMFRELLGPRLDHLDEQSEEFRSEIPL